jgi:superfamily II DNA or RNA helicase
MREKIQQEAMATWVSSGRRGTLCLPTGLGKTKCGVDLADSYIKDKKRVLVIVSNENLRDNEWPKEFKKWASVKHWKKHVNIQCIQTVYKWRGFDAFDLVILDEIHTMLSPKYGSIYLKINCDILGLTATPPKNPKHADKLERHCKVVYTYKLDEAVNYKILKDYMIYNLGVPLTSKERKSYNFFNNKFEKARTALNIYKKQVGNQTNTFDLAKELKDLKPNKYPLREQKAINAAKEFWQFMSLRKWVCYNNKNKLQEVLNMLELFPNRKWIIFTKSIKSCEFISEQINKQTDLNSIFYHSNMDKAERKLVLQKFERTNSKYKVLVSVDALAKGYDLPVINAAIAVSGVSAEHLSTQQLGRILRKTDTNEKGIFLNLYSLDTQEFTWVRNKTNPFKNCRWITNLNEINGSTI